MRAFFVKTLDKDRLAVGRPALAGPPWPAERWAFLLAEEDLRGRPIARVIRRLKRPAFQLADEPRFSGSRHSLDRS
jgi:hypothetical protein